MNKLHISIILSILITIFGIYIYKDANLMMKTSSDTPYVEQKNNQTIGYENGKRIFDIQIKKVRQNTYQHVLYATNIVNGTVYNHDEKKVITNLKGDHGRINTNIKSIIATANIEAIIEPTTSSRSIFVIANKFRYNHQKKAAHFYESSKLMVDDINIESNNFTYLNSNESIQFEDGFILKTNHSRTTLNRAIININKSQIIATSNVISRYKKTTSTTDSDQIQHLLKQPTTIASKKMAIDFSHKNNSIITYNNNVNVTQIGKTLKSDSLTLNFLKDTYSASSNILFSFENLNWLLNKKRKVKNQKIKKMLKKATKIKAHHAIFNPKENTFMLIKNIELKQSNFKLTCDHLLYDVNNEKIIMTGTVIIKKFGIEHLSSNKLIVDIKKETFRSDSKKQLSEIILEL